MPQFLSPQGTIASSWRFRQDGVISFNVSLPIGVHAASIVVPKPTRNGKPTARAVVKEQGQVVWDGKRLVGTHAGIQGGTDGLDGVTFAASNGVYVFESVRAAGGLIGD